MANHHLDPFSLHRNRQIVTPMHQPNTTLHLFPPSFALLHVCIFHGALRDRALIGFVTCTIIKEERPPDARRRTERSTLLSAEHRLVNLPFALSLLLFAFSCLSLVTPCAILDGSRMPFYSPRWTSRPIFVQSFLRPVIKK